MKQKKTKVISFLIIFPVIFIAFLLINSVLPEPLSNSLEFWNITPKDNIEFIDDNLYVNDKRFFIYSALNSNGNEEVYTIAVGDITGFKFNKYDILSCHEIEDSVLISSEYSEKSNISNFPELEVKNNSTYFGSIYVGTVPASCSSVLVNGIKAEMVKQTFRLNGRAADFYLYYCAIEDKAEANLTITDKDGTKYFVTPSERDGLMYPSIEII